MVDQERTSVRKALFVRLVAQVGREEEVESFLRSALEAVLDEPDTTTWYAVRFGDRDFAIFDTFPSDGSRLAHLAGKVGNALVARTAELLEGAPQIAQAQVLAYKLPGDNAQVHD